MNAIKNASDVIINASSFLPYGLVSRKELDVLVTILMNLSRNANVADATTALALVQGLPFDEMGTETLGQIMSLIGALSVIVAVA